MLSGLILAGVLLLSISEPASLAPYFALASGDSWTYQVTGSDAVVESRLSTAEFRGAPVVRREETGGGFQLESLDPERGWLLHLVGLPDGGTLELERGLVLLPVELEVGAHHQSLVRFVHREGDEKRDVGSITNEVTLVGLESLETPGGRFDNCLVVDRSLVRMFYSGREERGEGREWLARGVGLVKATGARDILLARGNGR